MPNPILYHNPRCSKSRQALAFILSKGLDIDVVEYLKNPLSRGQLDNLYSALKATKAVTTALDMVRTKEPEFAISGLTLSSSTNDVLNAITSYPKLLERPILLINRLAAIGRPLDNIEGLIDN